MKSLFFLTIALLLMLSLTACGDSAASPAQAAPTGDLAAGKQLYLTNCALCHGPAAQGLPGLGKNLVTSDFVAGKSDSELVEFIKVGRAADDPLNTTGVTMPPKGNNPNLTGEDLYHIVAYLHSIQQ
jgi:mono/diheme cytochrome c family protein